MDYFLSFLPAAIVLVAAVVIIYNIRLKCKQQINTIISKSLEKERELENLRIRAEKQALVADERTKIMSADAGESKNALEKQRNENIRLSGLLEKERAGNAALQEKLDTQKTELHEIRKHFTTEFENLAAKILKENSEEFTRANQKNIGEVLFPLKEKIIQFEKRVEDTYQKGLKDQTELKAELLKLYELNNRMSTEAENLTRALKGDVKKQGNWGEVVLERILERSGLNEGEQGFTRQYSSVGDDGRRLQPDIIINLPDQKHIIIDSKVSLVAYERAVNADTDDERNRFVQEHLQSLRSHVKALGEKYYQSKLKLNCPDFVLMFLPVESSFSMAVQSDQELFAYAWDRKVVLVSPSTLLATLRTVASIWQQENQTRNAIEIARQGGALYDKFAGFVASMEKIGSNLTTTRNTWEDAMKKLSEGRGNLVGAAERLRRMGAKASKKLPEHLLDKQKLPDDASEELVTRQAEMS